MTRPEAHHLSLQWYGAAWIGGALLLAALALVLGFQRLDARQEELALERQPFLAHMRKCIVDLPERRCLEIWRWTQE